MFPAVLNSCLNMNLSNKQNNLGFTPVQQGGGNGQSPNKIYIGWSGSRLKAQVDSTDLGNIVFDNQFSNNVLLSTSAFMNSSQVYYFSQNVSAQKSGIALVFSFYENGAHQDWGWHYFFVPKYMVLTYPGRATCFYMRWNAIDTDKIIYIGDNSISGNAGNDTGNNTRFVLRYVIGV